ncbi:ANTAR domain-containing protein [Nocardia amikacinitolerans]|uniref:ANTAR domain-containing protein n=1 Tax=Nocardia amikacinitolerans TaxID=756689 RepID=UPI0020A35D5F|nr:ANTAR domain-containing protein [Nocardia amikacinitolerans]MCP2287504.1 ANTAR domain-containing protein [Nocardia amikacinitolerans]
MQRAAITIDERDVGVQPWCSSDEVAARVETVQATVGEGTAVDAVATGMPVSVVDLTANCGHWPDFAAALAREPVSGAMTAMPMPMRLGAVRFGALDLYRISPGHPNGSMMSAGLHIADIITAHLVSPGSGSAEQAGEWLRRPLTSASIHQAAGMMIAQRGLGPADAYATLRSYAVHQDISLAEVAERVLRRRIRFGRDAR